MAWSQQPNPFILDPALYGDKSFGLKRAMVCVTTKVPGIDEIWRLETQGLG